MFSMFGKHPSDASRCITPGAGRGRDWGGLKVGVCSSRTCWCNSPYYHCQNLRTRELRVSYNARLKADEPAGILYFRSPNFKIAATGIHRFARSRMAGNLKQRSKKQYASQHCAFPATLSYLFHGTFVAWPPNNEGNQQQPQPANDQWPRYKQQQKAENLEHPESPHMRCTTPTTTTTISDNKLHLIYNFN